MIGFKAGDFLNYYGILNDQALPVRQTYKKCLNLNKI